MRMNWHPPTYKKQLTAVFTSEPEYSAVVHFGGVRVDGSAIPARPWMTSAIAVTDFIKEFQSAYAGDVEVAFSSVAIALHQEIKEQILSPIWQWDRITIRKSGEVARSPRDIYDSGDLHEGQKWYLK